MILYRVPVCHFLRSGSLIFPKVHEENFMKYVPLIHFRKLLVFLLIPVLLFSVSGCRVWYRTKISSADTIASRQFVQQAVESIEQKNMENAESQLALAVRANPENIEACSMYADALWNQGKRQEAIVQMEKVVRNSEVTPELVVKLSWMFFECGEYGKAQKYLTLGLKHDPELADAWLLLGKLHELQQKPELALNAYHQAVFHEPENGDLQLVLAQQYLKLEQFQRALESARAAKGKNSENAEFPAEILICEGDALVKLQRTSEAVQTFRLAFSKDLKDPELLSRLASAQLQCGDLSGAYQTAQRGAETAPQNEVFPQVLHQIQLASGTPASTLPASVPSKKGLAGTLAGVASGNSAGTPADALAGDPSGLHSGAGPSTLSSSHPSGVPEPIRVEPEKRIGREVLPFRLRYPGKRK